MYKNVQSKFEVCVGSQNFLVMVSWDCLPKVGLSNSSGRGGAAGDQFRERENTERQYTKLAVASTSGRQSRTMRHENIEKKTEDAAQGIPTFGTQPLEEILVGLD